MSNVTQVAFQVPDDDLVRLDRAVDDGFPSRAAALRTALREWLDRRQQEEIDRRLAEGYGAVEEDRDMTAAMARAGRTALSEADLDW